MVSPPQNMVSGAELLNDARIKNAKPKDRPYRLGDSGQLYLQVTPSGGRHWRMNYTFGRNERGKPVQKTLSFGSYPAVTLTEARAKRDKAKKILSQGKDPAVERRDAERAETAARRNTFRAAAEAWFELNSAWSLDALREWAAAHSGKWSHSDSENWTTDPHGRWSAVHAADVLTSMERDVLPFMGDQPIASLKASDVLAVLKPIEKRGAIETAHRLRQRISAVFVYGVAAGLCEGDPAASLVKALKPMPRSRPQPSIMDGRYDQISRITALRQLLIDCEAERCRAQTKLALRLLALTAVRPGDLAGARWEEFTGLDSASPLWTVPPERRKGTRAQKQDATFTHYVPLAKQSVELLATLRRLTGGYDLCFPSERHAHRPISENTLRALLIRAGYYQRHVPHGFRAAFSTYMNERPQQERQEGDRAVIDLMLAHVPKAADRDQARGTLVSDSEAAYNRAAYMPRRRELAQEWANVLLDGFWPPEALLGTPIRWAATGPGRPR